MTPMRSDREDFVEVVADQHDAAPPARATEQALLHRGASADVEAAAWTVGNDDLGLAAELAGDDQLLRVAAGEERRLLARTAHALDIELRPPARPVALRIAATVGAQPGAVAAVVHLTTQKLSATDKPPARP